MIVFRVYVNLPEGILYQPIQGNLSGYPHSTLVPRCHLLFAKSLQCWGFSPYDNSWFSPVFNSFSQIPMTKKCCILLSCCSMGVKTVVNRVTVIMVPEESDRLQSGCFWCLAICFPCDMIHWSMNGGFSWIFYIFISSLISWNILSLLEVNPHWNLRIKSHDLMLFWQNNL